MKHFVIYCVGYIAMGQNLHKQQYIVNKIQFKYTVLAKYFNGII